jgi:hypothetical protein
LIHTGAPVPIAQHRADLPPGFATLVQAAMASDRGQRTQTATELRAALERHGQIGFSTQIRNLSPRPSMVPARSIAPGAMGSLVTSAAGVSMRSPAAAANKGASSALLVVGGALGLTVAVAVGGGLWWSHQRSTASEVASAIPVPPAVPSPPVAMHEPASPPPTSAQPVAGPSVAPAVPDLASLRPNSAPAAPSARAAQSAVGSAAPSPKTAAPRQTGRADERGLAKDNPFK